MLPKPVVSSRKVPLSGGEVEIWPLTIAQSRVVGQDGDDKIAAGIAFATRLDPREVAEWLESAPAGDVTALLTAIADLSGLTRAAQFPAGS